MKKPLRMPSKRGDSFEDHVSVEVHFSNAEEMSDIRQSAEIQFTTLKIRGKGKTQCSLFVNGVDEPNGQRFYHLRSYIVLSGGKSYAARSSMTDLRREDLHLALGELIEDFQEQLRESEKEKTSGLMNISGSTLLSA